MPIVNDGKTSHIGAQAGGLEERDHRPYGATVVRENHFVTTREKSFPGFLGVSAECLGLVVEHRQLLDVNRLEYVAIGDCGGDNASLA